MGQLLDLSMVRTAERLPARGVVLVALLRAGEVGVVGIRPVDERVVQAHLEVLVPKRFDVRRDEIASRRGSVHYVEVGRLAVPQCHAVVMLGRQHRVAGSGAVDQFGPAPRLVALGRESVQLLHVVRVGDVSVVERPGLADAVDRVDPPVDEDAQLGLVEPAHPLGLVGCYFLRGCRSGYKATDQQRMDQGSQTDLPWFRSTLSPYTTRPRSPATAGDAGSSEHRE
jgi:hypothetical protein